MFEFELGMYVEDKVTGFSGIINGRAIYDTGCIQYSVKPKVKQDGVMSEAFFIDGDYLVVDPERSVESRHGDPSFTFELGVHVCSTKTPFKGYISAQNQCLNGCIQYLIVSDKLGEDGCPVNVWHDETELVVTTVASVVQERRTTGAMDRPSHL